MKCIQPAPTQSFCQRETGVLAETLIQEISRAIGRFAPDQRGKRVNDKPEAVFTSPQGFFCPLTLGNLLSQRMVDRFKRMVDRFKLQGPLGDAILQVLVEPPDFRFRPPVHGRCHHGGNNHDQGHNGNSIVAKGGDAQSVGEVRRSGGYETCGSHTGVMHCGDSDSHQHGAAQPSRDAPFGLLS